ncbi:pentatricopeptide repeat-containing protein At4g11690-like [Corylus avellana]|uniref:pentatricopeptide repeat-containing protein At4g11690-like n=1 Tax=Corylus avellana TaxID=13451 RepID=UPI001E20E768|nr:pentatricopeptide repeat-containing protein At4g11690-like [Corylus avellana]XP_059440111.1 pentatricopeptide repeat-containing protein At4g11690-like [Corylus avellana]XP_059440112.1 pentatricopeptide repeat-containing protein At4g11690-like [Corylus avellana]XP_059440113.1 pentatricopeptide repeat-containing protein At4g11690-like [Corylus avellana]XP_059440114.1 pentatricopeptide repeat-containing protein At4g11690-like [Corylus avellana]XP_059440115.1 pentatricopeptide repeat-containing
MRLLQLKQLQHVAFPSKPIISFVFQTPIAPLSSSSSSEASPASKPITNSSLTQEELTKINLLLLPRLCLSNHLPTAIHLTSTVLLTNPPPKSLSLSILVDSLTSQPDMSLPMSLLTHLKHNPAAHSHLIHITTMLIASYFKKYKPKEALKVFNWMVRPGSPCVLDEKVCGILVYGFCKQGMVLEALKVLRAMLGVNLVPGRDLGTWVYRGLLREARIKEALELNEALGLVKDVGGDEAVKKALGLLDHMIALWTD